MVNKIRAQQVVDHKIKSYTIDNYIMWFEKKEDDLNADYQRDYVWSEKEQQAFLRHLISGLPVGHISFVENEKQMYEVVDGKQRLTTLKLFVSNQLPIVLNGEVCHYSDLDVGEQRAFRNLMLPAIELLDNSEKAKIKYFIDINFSGVPQSKEHEEKVLKMYEALNFLTDYESSIDGLSSYISEYSLLDELNELATQLAMLSPDEIDLYQAAIEIGSSTSSIHDLIYLADNLDSFQWLAGVNNEYDLGYYWIEESGCYDLAQLGHLSHYFDYERYGRDVCLEQGGIFHSGGYVYHTGG